VAPLLAPTDELRAPSAGSLAAGRPADGRIPEASDIAAAAARALEAGSRPGAATTEDDGESDVEDGTPPFGAGRLGVGSPLLVGRGNRSRELQDGGGLCSPGLWPPERRRESPAPVVDAFRAELLSAMRGRGVEWSKRTLATLAAGKALTSPFSSTMIFLLRARLVALVDEVGIDCRPRPGDEDQPVQVRLLAALLADCSDPDAAGLLQYVGGVRVGVGVKMPRTPAVYPKKRRWALPTQADPDLLHSRDLTQPIMLDNYRSAKDLVAEVELDLEDLLTRGLCLRLSEAEAMQTFGSSFVVASLGALVKRIEDDGSRIIRLLFDGTRDVPLNEAIRLRDQEVPPGAPDLKRVLREQGRWPSTPFGLVADVRDAHRAVVIDPRDRHLLGCRSRSNGPIYFMKRGTFGVASASYWWGRLAAAYLRLAYRIVPAGTLFYGMVLADDFKFEAAGPNFVEILLLVVLAAEVLGFPWAWAKLRGGTDYSWVGYQHELREHALGLSASRAAWLRGWLGQLLVEKVVHMRDFMAGLGRASYSCGALEYDRPFLAPLYTFAAVHPPESRQPLPTYVLMVAKFLVDRLGMRRLYPCAQAVGDVGEAIRVDAKADGETATIGGWLPRRDAQGRLDPARSPWFFVALDDTVAPWAYERDRQPFRVIASLEALAVLVAILTLTAPASGVNLRGSVMLPLLTDNRGNSFALTRLMSTKYPLCLLVMELAVALEQRSLALTAEWAPREWNAEADDLTNQRFTAFDPSLRVPFDMASHKWLVLGDLLKAGRDFYAEAQVARASVRQSVAGVRRGGRGRAKLKERDPW
jgi:hypothetical protein